ncbi:hypothetical protein CSKR_107233 [Clonorchis sinensis]|uniref:Uncharacterized protein n=1 Tax=Clonorchis sinensis TaxID=79923 RepID=A0A3R7JGA5_CLOSI|nr:hypothetical protein CSKR_107233 [Clonorchis sinensis]
MRRRVAQKWKRTCISSLAVRLLSQGLWLRTLIVLLSMCGRHGTIWRNTLSCKQTWFRERLSWNSAESLICDVSRQLNVLHQAASCLNLCDIRDIRRHAQSLSFHQPYVLLEHKLYEISEPHLFENKFGFARDSPGTQRGLSFVMFPGD